MTSNNLPLVLIPGFMLDESLWDELLEPMAATRRIYRANLRNGQTIAEIARSIALQQPERFVLIGFSLGGYIARSLAEQFPERVAALILIASSLRQDTPEQKRIKQQAVKATNPNTFRGLSTTTIAKSLHPTHSTDKALIARIQCMGAQLGYEEFTKQSLLDRGGLSPEKIHCPTLVIAADQDGLRLPEEAIELRQAIAGSQLKIVRDTGHMIPLEQPEALLKIIEEWLSDIN